MNQDAIVQELMELLPETLHTSAAVAGSFAAVPDKAEDIDLWVLNVPKEAFDMVEGHIRRHLIAQDRLVPDAPHQGNYADSGDFRVVSTQGIKVDGAALYTKVQILISTQPTLVDLLGRFDITTHMAGWTLTDPGFLRIDPRITGTKEQPRVVNFERPEATLKRIRAIAPRYGFLVHIEDLTRLLMALPERPVVIDLAQFDELFDFERAA